MSPIAFYMSQFELSVLREVCPLSINVLLYLFANVFVFTLSWILTFRVIPKIAFEPRDLIQRYNLTYAILQLNFFIVLFVIQWILPESWKPVFSCLSIKIFYCLFAPFFTPSILFSILMKQKSLSFNVKNVLIILIDLFLFWVLRFPLEYLLNSGMESAVVQSSILFIAVYVFSWLQFEHGSRFFLPNCWRKKAYEYRRRIAGEFDLSKIDRSQWPEWYIWLEKLHHQSILRGQRSLVKLEGNQWYGMFLETMDGKNVHYFWYLWTIENEYHSNPDFYDIDKYDD